MPLARRLGGVGALVGTAFSVVFGAALAGLSTIAALGSLGVSGPLAAIPALAAGVGAAGVAFRLGDRALAWAKAWSAPAGDLVVGTDGVRWDGVFRRRFLPWSTIRSASVKDGVLSIEHGGGTVQIRTSSAEAVARIVEEAVAEHAARTPSDVPSVLEADRDARRWLERQRKQVGADYREGSADPTALLAVAVDPTAPPLARVGATLSLGKASEPERARVRVALEDVADEETLAALEAALDDAVSEKQVRALAARTR